MVEIDITKMKTSGLVVRTDMAVNMAETIVIEMMMSGSVARANIVETEVVTKMMTSGLVVRINIAEIIVTKMMTNGSVAKANIAVDGGIIKMMTNGPVVVRTNIVVAGVTMG